MDKDGRVYDWTALRTRVATGAFKLRFEHFDTCSQIAEWVSEFKFQGFQVGATSKRTVTHKAFRCSVLVSESFAVDSREFSLRLAPPQTPLAALLQVRNLAVLWTRMPH